MSHRRGVMSDEEGDTPAAAASLQQAATAAINNAVIEPAQLSDAARNMLLAKQQSDERQQQKQQRKQSLPNSPEPPLSPEPTRPSRKHARGTGGSSSSSSSAPVPQPSPLSAPPPESLSVFRLTQLNQLLRQHARRGNFIMLDLDETLMMTKHQPALLLSSYGVRMFQAYVRSNFADFATKNRLCRQLEAALKDKVLMESDTAVVVSELQRAGCWVFGVTARYPELSTNTQRTLLSLGIDLTSSAPFPRSVPTSHCFLPFIFSCSHHAAPSLRCHVHRRHVSHNATPLFSHSWLTVPKHRDQGPDDTGGFQRRHHLLRHAEQGHGRLALS